MRMASDTQMWALYAQRCSRKHGMQCRAPAPDVREEQRTAYLYKEPGLPVKALGKVIEDFDEAGSYAFPLCLWIFQTLPPLTSPQHHIPATAS